ncbi:zinc knuckle CX2CX4HX4C containing protein [Tanacetum coccineum]|uniref:Zinc knuckle CX2CX4HX4C containing protein n=1 Tax=Tanacetum coccineum TaxID=301880 RepID=A0ABQ5ED21_9ASTR
MELKESMVIAIPNLKGNGVILHMIRVEYEWEPLRCGVCMVFGHDDMTCPKCVGDEPKNKNGKNNDGFQQAPKRAFCGINMGPKFQFKSIEQVNQPSSKKRMVQSTSGAKKERKNKESILADIESESDVDEVYYEMSSFKAFKSEVGAGIESLYESCKHDYDE